MSLRTSSVLFFQFQGRLTLLLRSFVSSLLTNHWQSSVKIHRLWPQLTLIQNWKIIISAHTYQRSMLQVFGHVGVGCSGPSVIPNMTATSLHIFSPSTFSPIFSSKEDLRCAPRHGIHAPESIQVSQDAPKQSFEKARGMFLKNLPWVPAQGRHTLTRVGVPELDRLVTASTG